jgi:putative transcriptional regulator
MEARLQAGYTQLKLSHTVGITETAYQRLEAGKTNPGVNTALKIAKVLHKTVDDLFE